MIDSGPSLAVGDVDEDGQSELLTANYSTLFVHEVFGTSTWTTKTAYVRPTVGSNYPSFSNLSLFDLNRDNHLDAVLSGYDTKDVTLLRGAGDGSFVLDRILSATYGVYQTVAGDFTGDCRPDLMAAQFTASGSLLFFSGLENAEWSSASTLSANYGCDLSSADLDSDGWLDATLVHWGLSVCQLELNRGGGNFERKSFNCNSVEHHAIGDLNGDGRPDIVLSHTSPQYLSIVMNTSKP
ncbi:MAG: VCBS repeat-containing protein [Polyangiaceae bacterium]